jgi:ubiquinol-cytochrome c reductase cytochrome c subunit
MRTSILALCIVSAATVMPARAQSSTEAEHGHAVFVATGCYECHGTVGQGSRSAGPRLAPQPIPFEAFLQELRHPRNDMPPYVAQVLSDADARDIHAYLRSIPDPTHSVGDIPALNR